MKNVIILNVVTYIYLLCTVMYLVSIIFQMKRIGQIATGITILGISLHIAAFFLRWYESYQAGIGHLPIRGPYECITFSAGMIVLMYLVLEATMKTKAFGAFVLPCVSVMMIYATLNSGIDSRIQPMPEVLQGNYINYHLSSCFVGYAAFTISWAASILFLINSAHLITATNALKKIFIPSDILDDISYKMIAIGFIMFSIMLVTGMFRSKIVWGRYWEWDPVQTWSLLTWIVYAVILHGRYTWKWRGGITATFSIIGFGLSIVSFLIGAGFASPSLHFPITGQ
jgi:cytochrome c-type biogenesis protein CcsB